MNILFWKYIFIFMILLKLDIINLFLYLYEKGRIFESKIFSLVFFDYWYNISNIFLYLGLEC